MLGNPPKHLESKASFLFLILLNPNPPKKRGREIDFHFIQRLPSSNSYPPERKPLNPYQELSLCAKQRRKKQQLSISKSAFWMGVNLPHQEIRKCFRLPYLQMDFLNHNWQKYDEFSLDCLLDGCSNNERDPFTRFQICEASSNSKSGGSHTFACWRLQGVFCFLFLNFVIIILFI